MSYPQILEDFTEPTEDRQPVCFARSSLSCRTLSTSGISGESRRLLGLRLNAPMILADLTSVAAGGRSLHALRTGSSMGRSHRGQLIAAENFTKVTLAERIDLDSGGLSRLPDFVRYGRISSSVRIAASDVVQSAHGAIVNIPT